jgi:hypothetical protein
MRFQDLLSSVESGSPAEQQHRAARQFPDEVRAHGMRLWRPGDSYNSTGVRILVGVAAGYSLYDLQLMDDLDLGIHRGRLSSVALDVFDMSAIETQHELEAYIPGITPVNQTPVLGIWTDGVLRERLQGFSAKQRLLSIIAPRSLQLDEETAQG